MKQSRQLWVIDDDEDEHFLIRAALAHLFPGVRLVSFYSGEAFVNHLTQTELVPRLVLLDLNMPGFNGFDTLLATRMHLTGTQLPVIMLTNSANQEDKALALKLGANEFCTKSGDMAIFETLLRRLVADFGLLD
ncbi:response regulator [Fibrella forsythiae]|uniref:Response regulator n=1 Tax=Fibrella forsythiae TaxID=2817061 RepID=A0ABS3JTH4_9BACT|nr:response regulator [Fibrella forsythiae]MBO0953314.1 response regulator [Fibrella forsythiae]